ncbi:MAG: putative toxin-antitoxin system toxin component, PIN family [Chloroflexi bacterium]|nr:putative toxin-antitoxin system toxin component, PIN family [Chloroflexota bacterium]
MKVVLDLKVVMDTNVIVSGVFFSGPPFQILEAWQSGAFELAVSQEILEEYQRVGMTLQEGYQNVDLKPFLNFVIEHAKFYESVVLEEAICEDPDDDKFFACALASGSETIISGDKHLLKASGYQGIRVLKPRQFLDTYLR